jgi:hypothetical protein
MAFQPNGNLFGGQPTNPGKSLWHVLVIVQLTSRGQLTPRVEMRSVGQRLVVYLERLNKHPRLVAGFLERAMYLQPRRLRLEAVHSAEV